MAFARIARLGLRARTHHFTQARSGARLGEPAQIKLATRTVIAECGPEVQSIRLNCGGDPARRLRARRQHTTLLAAVASDCERMRQELAHLRTGRRALRSYGFRRPTR